MCLFAIHRDPELYCLMKTLTLAGGFGTRLAEETHTIPKPMLDLLVIFFLLEKEISDLTK
ncbi:hypothetical protein RJ53_01010 [Methanocalculus chunghsingensis]|uniref:Nucleotidyl transferase n=1 Tax=Methanocalculus chunghsingensis TaxID=156457 RepID=A0A8J7W7P7_9EURY|nr:hypothetical protein [Methanocalculus chunghsingensis]